MFAWCPLCQPMCLAVHQAGPSICHNQGVACGRQDSGRLGGAGMRMVALTKHTSKCLRQAPRRGAVPPHSSPALLVVMNCMSVLPSEELNPQCGCTRGRSPMTGSMPFRGPTEPVSSLSAPHCVRTQGESPPRAGIGSQASASGAVRNDVLSKPPRLWSAALAAWLTRRLS